MNLYRLVIAVLGLVGLSAAPLAAQNVSVQGIDSIQLRANVQPRFDTTTVDGEPETAWELRRARLAFRMYAAGWIRADLEGDFGRGRARLTDGFVQLAFDPRFTIRAGQFKKPFDTLELTSSRELLLTERDGLPRGASLPTPTGLSGDMGFSDRDVGVEWRGRFGRATLIAGFWNGAGTSAEDDDGKQVAARAEIAAPVGWRVIGAWGGIRRSAPADDEGAGSSWANGFEVAAGYGRYAEPGAKVLLQAMFGEGPPAEEPPADQPDFRALQAVAAWHVAVHTVPYLIGVEPAARLGWADPDSDVDDDEATLLSGGINLYHHEHVKTQLHVDHVSPAEGDGETAVRLQLTLGF
jgi:hypothetical protein